MLQQHSYKVRCVRSGMLILKATLIVILAPTMTLAQPSVSNLPVSTQAATPASQLTPLSEANCKPSDNPKEEKESFCGGVGGPDNEVLIDLETGHPHATSSPVTPVLTNPSTCHFEFGQGDWKTVCMIFQF